MIRLTQWKFPLLERHSIVETGVSTATGNHSNEACLQQITSLQVPMTRRTRESSNYSNPRSSQRRQFYVRISFLSLLLLTIAWGVFVYQVSPLRDPSFQPNGGNAGSLLPWLQGVRESDWKWGATGLAGLWAVNTVVWLWHRNQTARLISIGQRQRGTTAFWRGVHLVTDLGIGLVTFAGLWLGFMAYLMAQWLVD